MTIRAQNFSKKEWNHFYVRHLHNSSTLSLERYKPNELEGKRDLCPFHFETKRKNNKWPSQKIDCDCKLTYLQKTMNGNFIGYMKHKNRSMKHKQKFM